ncbi:MAG: CoB--CoM heterodisulfide reductase iron-sulfur subunit B family protein [Metallosphaera sp.]|uniref:Succinate dehydrogenase subunit C n=1 Tax=Metallosphaera cuprina (strain Ar-4) TaxID=1006006 RepID=F4FYJ8_METCR|nr:CoB--CoM heterodisulfide reductase iron-sulfur subunit B family protein [Metallosphaera cuprina]AEB95496.1 succinate dehydrogenase subunit C [Metallosphaera cuprina Ar-4]
MKVAYYPGCATHGLSKDVDVATKKVAEVLGLELVEVEDWNCCGGGFLDEYDEKAHVSLNLRNLSKVEKMGLSKMATPCSVCLQSHRLAVNNYKENTELKKEVDSRLKSASIEYKGTVDAEHIVWVLVRDVGVEKIKSHVTRPLSQLKVATYYGCQMLRPEKIMGFESPYNTHSLEDLVSSTGATPVRFPMATACCGFPLMGSNPKGGLKLAYNVLNSAKSMGADIMIHPCSLCHLQLDVTQYKVMDEFKTNWTMPTMYVTQLLAIAFGISPKELGLSKIAMKALEQRGIT